MSTDDPTSDAEEPSPFQAESEFDATFVDVYEAVVERWILSPLRVLWDDYRGRFGLTVLTGYILLAVVGPIVYPEPEILQYQRLQPAFTSMKYPLGTNKLGEDLLAKIIAGAPRMFKMMLAGAIFGNGLGLTIGLFSGYLGGNVDKVLMTLVDIIGSIPGVPLLLILAALFEPKNAYLIGVMVSITSWTGLARQIRSQVLPLVNVEYVESSRSMGQSTSNVLIKQVFPEILPLWAFGFFSGATGVIRASVALYFLGILPVDRQNWGWILNQAYQNSAVLSDPRTVHWLLVPVVAITGLTFALTMTAQAMEQVFNPRVRSRHEARKHASDQERLDEEETTEEGYAGELL